MDRVKTITGCVLAASTAGAVFVDRTCRPGHATRGAP
jgi:hypothetical protein